MSRAELLFSASIALAAPCRAMDLLGGYQQALANDALYQSAKALERADKMEVAKAAAGFLPSVNFSGSASRNSTENTSRAAGGFTTVTRSFYLSESYNLSMRQPLFRAQNWSQLRQARATATRGQASLRQEGQSLALRVAAAYFDALLTEAQLQTESAKKETLERTLASAEKALAAGAGTLTDVYEVRARRDLAQAVALEAENALHNALWALQAVTNAPPGPLAKLDLSRLPLGEAGEPLERWLERAEAANPALLALRGDVEIADEEAAKAKSGHYPSLDMIMSHRRASNELEISLNRESVTSLVGLQVNVPLFSGGYTHAAAVQALAKAERARQRLEAGRREIGLGVRRELGNLRQNAARVSALQQAVSSVEQALSATEKGVAAGTRTIIDVLNAQDMVFRTKAELAKSSYLFVMSFLRLRDAAGSLDEGSIRAVNQWLEPDRQ